MPIYQHACKNCKNIFEKIHSKPNEDPYPCPNCGKPAPQIHSVPSPMRWGKGGGF